jgi:protein-tyrosine-phosphatase
MDKQMKLLVICHGNINRSPLAAAVLAQHDHIEVRQGRLKFGHRLEKASKKMRDAAAKIGIDLSKHRSRDITLEDIEWADAVIYMDAGNLKRLNEFVAGTEHAGNMQVFCLAEFDDPPGNRIPDPAFIARDTPEFAAVVELIVRSAHGLADSVVD